MLREREREREIERDREREREITKQENYVCIPRELIYLANKEKTKRQRQRKK